MAFPNWGTVNSLAAAMQGRAELLCFCSCTFMLEVLKEYFASTSNCMHTTELLS